ncbi:hypothetical protein GGX14DRAFT_377116, partial [Mycena pura]
MPGSFPSSSQNTVDDILSETELYCRQLLRQKRGFPLYNPKPRDGLPDAYRSMAIHIGDVGRVTSKGAFDFFFNIYLEADDPVHNNDVPEGFVPLPRYVDRDLERGDYEPGNCVLPPSIRRDGITNGFSCSGPNGAILALPHGSHWEKLDNVEHLRHYIVKHAENWYKYANVNRGRGLVNGSLYLITGWEKASNLSYGIASF